MSKRDTSFEHKGNGSVVITSRVTLYPKNKLHSALLTALINAPNMAGVLRSLALRGIEDIAEQSGVSVEDVVLSESEIEDMSLRLGTQPQQGKSEVASTTTR